ncbi:hypothetical protein D3C72_1662160 [compost metagenome]
MVGANPMLTVPARRASRAAAIAFSACRSVNCAWRRKAVPAGVGVTPVGLRVSSRVASSLSSRLICWLSAEATTPRSRAARPMLPSSATRTK